MINKVVAYVGNNAITLYDVQSLDPKEYARIIAIEDEEARKTAITAYEEQALEFLINQEVIVLSAEREGIIVKDEEVDSAIAEVATRSGVSVDELADLVEQEGLSVPMYRSQIKTEILNARVRMQVLAPKTVVSENDLRRYVDSHPDEFSLYNKYNVRILMTSTEDALENAINAIEDGMKFEDAVKQYSVDASAANGGAMGWMEPELLPDNMRNALESSTVDNITEPFEVNNQWAVFMVDDYQSKYDFDEDTREQITMSVSEDIFSKVFTQWLEKNKETIVIMRAGEMF